MLFIKLKFPKLLSLILFLIFGIVLELYMLFPESINLPILTPKLTIPEQAKVLSESCKGEEQCYAKAFSELTKKNDYHYVISVLKTLNQIDSRSRGCHLIGHSIAIAETEKNPSNWLEVLGKMDVNICSGGLVHGVIEAHTRQDPNFRLSGSTITSICSSVREKLGGGGEYNCAHIMGHLTMAQEVGKTDKAVKICDQVNKVLRAECYGGIFMENETRDNLIIHAGLPRLPWTDKTIAMQENICRAYSGERALPCWKEIAHLYAARYNYYPPDVYTACTKADTQEDLDACYFHGLGIMVASSSFNLSNMPLICKPYATDQKKRTECQSWVIGSLLSSSLDFVDRVQLFCQGLGTVLRVGCYNRLGEVLSWRSDASQITQTVCSKIPEEFQINCLNPKKS